MQVTNVYKKDMSRLSENGVVALSRAVGLLQFVNKPQPLELANSLHEFAGASQAEGAVDITFLISYADLHALCLDGFFCSDISRDLFKDLSVKVSYLFTDESGHHYCIPHDNASYIEKYLRKEIVAARMGEAANSGCTAITLTLTRFQIGELIRSGEESRAAMQEALGSGALSEPGRSVVKIQREALSNAVAVMLSEFNK